MLLTKVLFDMYRIHTATKIPFMCSQKRNCAASVRSYTFMCLSAFFIFPGLVCIFCLRKTHEYENWDWDHAIPFLGIFASNYRYCVFAVQHVHLAKFTHPRRPPNYQFVARVCVSWVYLCMYAMGLMGVCALKLKSVYKCVPFLFRVKAGANIPR